MSFFTKPLSAAKRLHHRVPVALALLALSATPAFGDLLTVEAAEEIGILRAVDATPLPAGSAVRLGTFDYSSEGDAWAFIQNNQYDLAALEANFTEYGSFAVGDGPPGSPPFFQEDGSFKVTLEGDFNLSSKPVFIWIVNTTSFPEAAGTGLEMGIFSGTGSFFGNDGTLADPQLHVSSMTNTLTLNFSHFDLAYVGSHGNGDLLLAPIPEPLHLSAALAVLAALSVAARRGRKQPAPSLET